MEIKLGVEPSVKLYGKYVYEVIDSRDNTSIHMGFGQGKIMSCVVQNDIPGVMINDGSGQVAMALIYKDNKVQLQLMKEDKSVEIIDYEEVLNRMKPTVGVSDVQES